jgi:DNA-binding NarL/FixJ family response regulator
MIKVFIADDHAMMREGLKRMIASNDNMEVVGEAGDGEQALENLQKSNASVLMMDMSMPGLSGIELIKEVKKSHPKLPILVLSMHNSGKVAYAALQAGASGYLAKDSDPGRLTEIIQKIANGGRFIDPVIADKIAFEHTNEMLPHEQLTEREREILLMIVTGESINNIAAALQISPKTVSTHKKRMMEKMNISNNADLVRYADEHHLTD